MYVCVYHSPPWFLRQGLSLNLELTDSTRWTGQQASKALCLHLPSTRNTSAYGVHWVFHMGTGDRNSGPHAFGQQEFGWLSHVFCPPTWLFNKASFYVLLNQWKFQNKHPLSLAGFIKNPWSFPFSNVAYFSRRTVSSSEMGLKKLIFQGFSKSFPDSCFCASDISVQQIQHLPLRFMGSRFIIWPLPGSLKWIFLLGVEWSRRSSLTTFSEGWK